MLSSHRNAGQNCDIKADIKSFEILAKFKLLETLVANQSCVHESCKSRRHKFVEYFVQFSYEFLVFVSSSFQKRFRIKYKKLQFCVTFYGCVGIVMAENRLLRIIFEPTREGSDVSLDKIAHRSTS